MKKIILLFFIVVTVSCSGYRNNGKVVQSSMSDEVFFKFDSYSLSEVQKEKIDDLLKDSEDQSEITVVLEGYTDPYGENEYNYDLGDLRAREVKAYLLHKGIKPSQIITVTYGESHTSTSKSFAQLRKVVIKTSE